MRYICASNQLDTLDWNGEGLNHHSETSQESALYQSEQNRTSHRSFHLGANEIMKIKEAPQVDEQQVCDSMPFCFFGRFRRATH